MKNIRNGSICEKIKVNDTNVKLVNTCAFDAVVHTLTNSASCRKFLLENNKKNQTFVDLCTTNQDSFYKKRAAFLCGKFPFITINGTKVIDCNTSITEVLQMSLSDTPFQSVTHDIKHEEKLCSALFAQYNINENILMPPTSCNCGVTIRQKTHFSLLTIYFSIA